MCPQVVGTERVAPISSSVAATIRTRVEQKIGGAVRSVCRMPFGLYEVVDDMDVVYVDARVRYLIVGRAFALHGSGAEDLTTSRQEAFRRVDVKALPFAMAVKTVRGDGSRLLVEFEDPNCPYCRRFEREIVGLNNVTIYTFLYPVLSRNRTNPDDSYPQARSVWCSANRSHSWDEVMLKGERLPPAPASCDAPLDQNLALGRKLKITGTPTLIFADGRRIPGVISLASVEHLLNVAEKEKLPKR
ncbi:protein-disulfide isomerase [Burkholderiales bacterium GJ-E10]|nr:protein-disulfide isomerase [Burkholderiales bacterium GJ-E10]